MTLRTPTYSKPCTMPWAATLHRRTGDGVREAQKSPQGLALAGALKAACICDGTRPR